MLILHCIELVYCKNHFNLIKYFFWGYSIWRQIKLSAPICYQIFCDLEVQSCEIYRCIRRCVRRNMLSENIFTNWLNLAFHHEVESKKKKKKLGLCGKKKFRAQRSLKKVMLSVFWSKKRPFTIDFVEKWCKCKQCFQLPIPFERFTLFIEWSIYQSIYILHRYICIYLFNDLSVYFQTPSTHRYISIYL